MAFNPEEYTKFNPEEYTKESFDPVKYTSSGFDPKAYSESKADLIPDNGVDASAPTTDTVLTPLAKDIAQYGPVVGPLAGLGDAAGTLTTGLAGMGTGLLNVAKNIVTGNKQSAADAYAEGMGNVTWQPHSETGQQIQENVIDPAMSNLMGIAGMAHTLHTEPTAKMIERSTKEFNPKEITAHTELSEIDFAKSFKNRIDDQIEVAINKLNELANQDGNDPLVQQAVSDHASNIQKLTELRDQLQAVIDGKTPEELNFLKQKKPKAGAPDGISKETFAPEEIEKQVEELNKQRDESLAAEDPGPTTSQNEPFNPYEYLTKEEPKQSPQETALNKIGEAYNMGKAELADRILDTQDKLDATEDKPENSSLRAALEQELKAYDSIAKGERPDLSWFEGKEESGPNIEYRTYSDGEQYIIEYDTRQRSDGSFALVRTIIDSSGRHEIEHLSNDGTWKKGEPATTVGYGAFSDEGAPEGFRTKEEALKFDREDKHSSIIEGINVEEIHPEEVKTTINDVPEVKSVEDIFNNRGDIFGQLEKHREDFFNTIGSTHFDKRFDSFPNFQKIVSHFLDVTGLNKHNIFITLEDGLDKGGSMNHGGNDTYLRISKSEIDKYVNGTDFSGTDFGNLKGKNLENAKLTYAMVRVAAHEIGHTVLNQYIKSVVKNHENLQAFADDFNQHIVKADFPGKNLLNVALTDFWAPKSAKGYSQRQQYFHEYFAERITKELLSNHTMGAFSRGRGLSIKPLIDAAVAKLKSIGAFANRKLFAEDIVQNIIKTNENSIKTYGKTIWERLDTQDSISRIPNEFKNYTLQDILNLDTIQDQFLPPTRENSKTISKDVFLGLDKEDADTVPNKVLALLQKGALRIAEPWFNRNSLESMANNARVSHFHYQSRQIDLMIDQLGNALRFGDKVPKGMKGLWSKFANPDSWAALRNGSDLDFAAVHDFYKYAFEKGLRVEDALKEYEGNLSSNQVDLARKLESNVFDKMYKMRQNALDALGKNTTINNRPGYYSSSRPGRYQVSINFGGIIAHLEGFHTKLRAEKFKQQIEALGWKHFDVSDVLDSYEAGDPNYNIRDYVEAIVNTFAKLDPKNKAYLETRGQRLLESMLAKGGKIGYHQEFRENVPGYLGSQLFQTREELGAAFRKGIDDDVNKTPKQIKTLWYRTELQPMLESKHLTDNQRATMQRMWDISLGSTENVLGEAGEKISYMGDQAADQILKALGRPEGKQSDVASIPSTVRAFQNFFYLAKVLPKPVFAIFEHFVSAPAMTVAKMAEERPLGALKSIVGGTLRMMTGYDGFHDVIKQVAQRTSTFEPSLIEAIQADNHDSAALKFVKNWILLQTPAKVGELSSRMWTFSCFYDHYRALGMDKEDAINMAMIKTPEALSSFETDNHPTIYRSLGPIGTAMKPLTTFSMNQMGNLIGMMRKTTINPKTWVPLLSFVTISSMLTGAIGLPLAQEYEELRKWLGEKDFATLPSLLDIIAKRNDTLDKVISPETRTLGILQKSGYDLAASARADVNPLVKIMFAIGQRNLNGTMPIVDSTAGDLGALSTLATAPFGHPTQGDLVKAANQFLPGGPVGYGAKEMLGLNTTKMFGKNTENVANSSGEAKNPRTDEDRVAGILGTTTISRKMNDLAMNEQQENERIRKLQFDHRITKFTETGDAKWLQGLETMFPGQSEIQDKIETAIHNRTVPELYRELTDKSGNIIKGRGERGAILFNKFGRLK
jgi:hypothetical protein